MRRPWAVKPEQEPRKGTPHERVTKTHSAATGEGESRDDDGLRRQRRGLGGEGHLVGVLVAFAASVFSMGKLEEMVNIGTLFAFVLVSAGVIVLRRTRPDLERASGRRGCRCCRSRRSWPASG
jgi:hypothetical protein